MSTKVSIFRNSRALRIPKSFPAEIGPDNNIRGYIALVDGKLIVTALRLASFILDIPLASITNNNLNADSYAVWVSMYSLLAQLNATTEAETVVISEDRAQMLEFRFMP